ncbi:MAG: CotH kinase family protein [Oscillospiraceae bacterium]
MKAAKIYAGVLSALIASGIFSGCAVEDTGTDTEVQTSSAADIAADDIGSYQLVFSHESGFYKDSFELEITCSDPEAKIYYTTDGSIPDETSTLYSGPISLQNRTGEPNVLSAQTGISVGERYIPREKVIKANVIRAAAVYGDGSTGDVLNGTFFVGIDREKEYGDVPVISVMTDFDNLFDYETGIYVMGETYDSWIAEDENNKLLEGWRAEGNYTNRGREWERTVSFELITSDGSAGFSQDMGVRIMGAASRNAPQKSLRFIAREEYGSKAVNYELIPDNIRSDGEGEVEKYKSFLLRNGGNDCDYAKIRDPLFQECVTGRRFETQQYTPCVAFINGEYWGMYTITEDYNDNYIENNYGIDNNNVIMIKCGEVEEGEESDISYYNEMYDFIVGNDMSDPANYEKACEMLDIGSYIDYAAFNLYICNEDSFLKDNNWRMWRVKTPDDSIPAADGKWRMMVYDTDYSAGIYNGGSNYGWDNISEYLRADADASEGQRRCADMFRALYANEDFKKELVLTMCDMRNYDFEATAVIDRIAELDEVYGSLVPDTFMRFGPEWLTYQPADRYYGEQINSLAVFVDGRYSSMPDVMKKAFGLGSCYTAEISCSDSTKGTVIINNTVLTLDEAVRGKYFSDHPITVTAVPNEGESFKEWIYTGCEISSPTSPSAEITVTGDITLRAVFE